VRFERILSFGRTGEELLAMFAIDPHRLEGLRVLDCPGGPGSLTALLRSLGARPIACDPSYTLAPEDLESQTRADIAVVAQQLSGDPVVRDGFDQAAYGEAKLEALRQFQHDRQAHPGEYVAAALPALPFADDSFDLVLSGSLLFAYAPVRDGGLMEEPGLGLDWHRQALAELLRVSGTEVRLYPAHTLQGPAVHRHPYVEPLLRELPPRWRSELFETRYDQGLQGELVGLRLVRE
jgi:hypothetical protein